MPPPVPYTSNDGMSCLCGAIDCNWQLLWNELTWCAFKASKWFWYWCPYFKVLLGSPGSKKIHVDIFLYYYFINSRVRSWCNAHILVCKPFRSLRGRALKWANPSCNFSSNSDQRMCLCVLSARRKTFVNTSFYFLYCAAAASAWCDWKTKQVSRLLYCCGGDARFGIFIITRRIPIGSLCVCSYFTCICDIEVPRYTK